MYSRRTCGLCDRARLVVEIVRGRRDFGFAEVFIDGDEALEREYGLRVPVVLVDGEEAFEVELTAEDLEDALASRA
ncbi:MAG TPA: glutaredoxin family protein [Actinomycetota bacterium]|nr:glutaredoxin family protein [Actinomycetota bacterium]